MERSARTVPIDVVVRRCSRSVATAAVTTSIGSGWFAEAAAEAAMSVYFQAARPAPVATTVARSTTDAIHPREFRNARLMLCGSLGSDVVPGASLPGR